MVSTTQHSLLWGLVNWQTTDVHYEDKPLGQKTIKRMQNFFRMKALEGFYKEGVIDSINYVESMDAITEDTKKSPKK